MIKLYTCNTNSYQFQCYLQKLGRGEIPDDEDPFGKGTGEARDDIAAMDRQDAVLVRILGYNLQ